MTRLPATPRVADLLVDALGRAGVETIFAAPRAGMVAAVVDGARARRLRVIDVMSPAAACAMGAATGLLTDAPGVAVVDARQSPGELLEAVAQAGRDGAPLVLVTDRPFARLSAAEDAVKASVSVAPAAAAHWSAHACQAALAEPRGPVHLVVPADAAAAPAVPVGTLVRPPRPDAPAPAVLDTAGDLLARARHPILVAGRQCRGVDAATWLRALAEALPAPTLVTSGGKGAFPDPHPLHLGLLDRADGAAAILGRGDLVVAIGVDAREVAAGALPPGLPILHLAAAPWMPPDALTRAAAARAAEVPPRTEVVGEIAMIIEELAPRLRGRARADWDVAELDRLRRAARVPSAGQRAVWAVVEVVREATPAGTVAVAAAGDHADAVVAAWQAVAPGELIAPLPPQRPGLALDAATAAALARPRVHVVCFARAHDVVAAADALDLAARLALRIVVLVVGDDRDPRTEALVDTGTRCGWTARAAPSTRGVGAAVTVALASGRPTLVDARGAGD